MTTTATLPPVHAPYVGGDADEALREARRVIEHAITHQPRSLQERIGPSEIGNPCDHCLAAKLAGWKQTEDGVPWLPFLGTAAHTALEEAFIAHENARNANHTTGRRYLAEQRVMVGHIGGEEIWGSCDLFDTAVGMTVDWKIVGPTTLKRARSGPSNTYRVQGHCYGRGYVNAGYRVEHIAIAFLPRNSVTLNDAIWWTEPYNETVAVKALERANRLHTNLAALAQVGTEVRDAWITSLDRADGCFECHRYNDKPAGLPRPGRSRVHDDLAGLIPPGSNPAAGNPAA